jgi:hypothetical protein
MRKLVLTAVAAAIALGLVVLVLPTPVEAGPPCVIRCSDLEGCVKCCVQKGGWVCNPV